MYVDSRGIDCIVHSDMSEEDIFDPTSISNGGWDQKLDHFREPIFISSLIKKWWEHLLVVALLFVSPASASLRRYSRLVVGLE